PLVVTANTGVPTDASAAAHAIAPRLAVSTATTARSPSASTPRTCPVDDCPSLKVTVVSAPRRLWAFVSTRPSATTTPAPRPPPAPMRTTAGATLSTTTVAACCNSSRTAMCATPVLVTCDVQVSTMVHDDRQPPCRCGRQRRGPLDPPGDR